MIAITDTITIDEREINVQCVRASGPGGQNVNKVATAVKLRFDVKHSPSLPDDVRQRMLKLGGKRITDEGVLIIDARRYRTQERNRHDALDRLVSLVREAKEQPKMRRKTRPSPEVKKRRVEAKRQRGKTKRLRQPPVTTDE